MPALVMKDRTRSDLAATAALRETVRGLIDRGGPYSASEVSVLREGWVMLKGAPVEDFLDVAVALELRAFRTRPPLIARGGPSPFDEQIEELTAQIAEVAEKSNAARTAEHDLRFAPGLRPDFVATAEWANKLAAAEDARVQLDREHMLLRSRLTALQAVRDQHLHEQMRK